MSPAETLPTLTTLITTIPVALHPARLPPTSPPLGVLALCRMACRWRGLLEALSGLVEPARPWWTPTGIAPVFPPPGISVNVDVTVPLDALLPDDRDPGYNGRSLPARRGRAEPTTDGRTLPGDGRGGARGAFAAGAAATAADAVAEVTIGTSRVPVPASTGRALRYRPRPPVGRGREHQPEQPD